MVGTIAGGLLKLYTSFGNLYLAPILFLDWRRRRDRQVNERPVEYSFALECLAEVCPATVLDVGAGTTAWPQLMTDCGFQVTAIDQIRSYWGDDSFNRHYYVQRGSILSPKITQTFDFITCISVLEHISDHQTAVSQLLKLLNPGGYLVLTFPYNEQRYVRNVYAEKGAGYGQDSPFACQICSRKEIESWIADGKAQIEKQEYFEVFTGDLWTFGDRIYPPRPTTKEARHHLTCLLIRKSE